MLLVNGSRSTTDSSRAIVVRFPTGSTTPDERNETKPNKKNQAKFSPPNRVGARARVAFAPTRLRRGTADGDDG